MPDRPLFFLKFVWACGKCKESKDAIGDRDEARGRPGRGDEDERGLAPGGAVSLAI